jgi:hypothetical protein
VAAKPSEKDLVIGSQGLRGSNPGVVWRRETEPAALETRLSGDEINNLIITGELTWQIYNRSKIPS